MQEVLHEQIEQLMAESEVIWRTLGVGESGDRRRQARSAYECLQLVAPYDGKALPTQADFSHVMCRDISIGGLSFYAAYRPTCKQIVVMLGQIPFSFFAAEIVRVTPGSEGDFLIGCRFLKRLN